MNKRSFTLTELIITVGLMSFALALTVGILSSVVRTDNKQKVLMHIQRSGDSALDVIEEIIRKAAAATCVDEADFQTGTACGLDTSVLRLAGGPGGDKYIGRGESLAPCSNGVENGFLYVVDSKAEYDAGQDTIKLTNDSVSGGINITKFDFAVYSGTLTRVSVSIEVAGGCQTSRQKEFETLVTLLGS